MPKFFLNPEVGFSNRTTLTHMVSLNSGSVSGLLHKIGGGVTLWLYQLESARPTIVRRAIHLPHDGEAVKTLAGISPPL